jgi:hypothetical protein
MHTPLSASSVVPGAAERGPGQDLWVVWSAGVDWLSWTMASGAYWHGGWRWLLSEALDQWVGVLVMPVREGEGKVRCEWCLPVG